MTNFIFNTTYAQSIANQVIISGHANFYLTLTDVHIVVCYECKMCFLGYRLWILSFFNFFRGDILQRVGVKLNATYDHAIYQ